MSGIVSRIRTVGDPDVSILEGSHPGQRSVYVVGGKGAGDVFDLDRGSFGWQREGRGSGICQDTFRSRNSDALDWNGAQVMGGYSRCAEVLAHRLVRASGCVAVFEDEAMQEARLRGFDMVERTRLRDW